MTYVKQPLTNNAYGKRDSGSVVEPVALACLHITGNSRTAAYTDLHAAAQAEWKYANRAGSGGPSAHFYVARDGWAIMAINPNLYWAWSNGDVKSPHRSNPGVDRVLRTTYDKGINTNRAYWLEFENVGYGKDYPVNAKQRQFCAEQIAAMAKAKGMKINRETVHGHWEINGVDRQTCPSPDHEGFLNDVIARANLILNPPPPPAPAKEPSVYVTDKTVLEVDARVGAIVNDLNNVRIADIATRAFRPSPFGVLGGRALIVTVGDKAQLGIIKDADILAKRAPSTDAEVAALKQQVATLEASKATLTTALSTQQAKITAGLSHVQAAEAALKP